jgi:hypothetical protein
MEQEGKEEEEEDHHELVGRSRYHDSPVVDAIIQELGPAPPPPRQQLTPPRQQLTSPRQQLTALERRARLRRDHQRGEGAGRPMQGYEYLVVDHDHDRLPIR